MILAIDTATRWTGLALYDGANAAVLASIGWTATNTQTIELAPTIHDMLRRTNVTMDDLTALVVAIGPGSYTGLRVGLGFAKGLALVHSLPIIGISTLDCIAHGIGDVTTPLIVVCEAGRKRVCTAAYHWQSYKWTQVTDADIYDWPTLIAKTDAGTAFVGEIPIHVRTELVEKRFKVLSPAASTRHATHLAELGYARLLAGDVDAADSITPIYLRDPAGAKPKQL